VTGYDKAVKNTKSSRFSTESGCFFGFRIIAEAVGLPKKIKVKKRNLSR